MAMAAHRAAEATGGAGEAAVSRAVRALEPRVLGPSCASARAALGLPAAHPLPVAIAARAWAVFLTSSVMSGAAVSPAARASRVCA